MARRRNFAQIDVFGTRPLKGNPVAVILDAEGLDDKTMQDIARWTNLSETTFILPPTQPEADYRLRIFTPSMELPFAGHPTLGSAYAWVQRSGYEGEKVVQECGAGLVELRAIPGGYSFAAPPTIRSGPIADAELTALVHALGIAPEAVVAHQWVDNGPGFACIEVATAAEVSALQPDFSDLPDACIGVIGAYEPGKSYEIRSFVPGAGVSEDPVTGSLNAGVAQWFVREGKVQGNYQVKQGSSIGYDGELSIRLVEGQVWVGGATRTIISGTIHA